MIRIIFKEGQGLGNQLWLFTVAKSISEKLNYELEIENIEKFKALNFLKLDCKNFVSESEITKKYNMHIFNESIYYDAELRYLVSGYDQNILNIKENTIIEGIFQSEKYFFDDLEKIKRYISFKDQKIFNMDIADDVCILNIRGGEYKRHKNFILPKSYWEMGMENIKKINNIKNFKIVTDDYRYAKALFPNFEIISESIEQCYLTIFNCKNIIVSNSTFSYFPCKTGKVKNVIAPMFWARPLNKKNRWVSPANIYKDWLWQDLEGNLSSYEECIEISEQTEKYYKNNFTILVNKNALPSTGIFNFLPRKIKSKIKKLLSYILPTEIG